MSLLSERLPNRSEDVCFSMAGDEIGASLDRDESVSVTTTNALKSAAAPCSERSRRSASTRLG